jgi:hypothetical protein
MKDQITLIEALRLAGWKSKISSAGVRSATPRWMPSKLFSTTRKSWLPSAISSRSWNLPAFLRPKEKNLF